MKTLSFDEIHKIFDDDRLMDDWQFNAINIFTNNQSFKLLRYEKEKSELVKYTLDEGLRKINNVAIQSSESFNSLNGYFEHQ